MSDDHSNTELKQQVIEAIRTVEDPEIPVNLYDLGLIYRLDVSESGDVAIDMTLTTPNCPVAESMPEYVRKAVASVAGVQSVNVTLVWEPAWSRSMMSVDAQLLLEMMGIEWSERGDPTVGGARPTGLTVGKSGSARSGTDADKR